MPTQRTALLAQTGRALGAAELFLAAGRARLVVRVAPEGNVEPERFATEQLAAHALAWIASYVEALRQMRNWAVRLDEGGRLGEIEANSRGDFSELEISQSSGAARKTR